MPAKPKKNNKPLICYCACPRCDAEMEVTESPFCEVCKVTFGRCSHCGAIILEESSVTCRSCGKPLK